MYRYTIFKVKPAVFKPHPARPLQKPPGWQASMRPEVFDREIYGKADIYLCI